MRPIVPSNLPVILDPTYGHVMDVFAANNVERVGSLPDTTPKKPAAGEVGISGPVIKPWFFKSSVCLE
jgi:hypothetical protein